MPSTKSSRERRPNVPDPYVLPPGRAAIARWQFRARRLLSRENPPWRLAHSRLVFADSRRDKGEDSFRLGSAKAVGRIRRLVFRWERNQPIACKDEDANRKCARTSRWTDPYPFRNTARDWEWEREKSGNNNGPRHGIYKRGNQLMGLVWSVSRSDMILCGSHYYRLCFFFSRHCRADSRVGRKCPWPFPWSSSDL